MVAFTAILSKSISRGSKQVIRYDKIITNVGKAYTPSTGIFIVPHLPPLYHPQLGSHPMSSALKTTVLLTELKRMSTKTTSNGYLNIWYVKGKAINLISTHLIQHGQERIICHSVFFSIYFYGNQALYNVSFQTMTARICLLLRWLRSLRFSQKAYHLVVSKLSGMTRL
jgi:hypothetical protein